MDNETKDLLDKLTSEIGTITGRQADAIEKLELRFQRSEYERHPDALTARGPFLSVKHALAPHFRIDACDYDANDVRMGALIGGLIQGKPAFEQMREAERKAFDELSPDAGGYLIPAPVAALWIDSVRPASRVMQAGARSYGMSAPIEVVPGWDPSDLPTGAWRAESAGFNGTGGKFQGIPLAARMCYAVAEYSLEIEQDAATLDTFSTVIESELSKALASALDRAVLVGDPTAGEPQGILGTLGVPVKHLGGVPASYDFLVSDYFTVAGSNHEPNAVMYSSRTAETLALLKDGYSETSLRQLPVPDPLAALPRLVTNQIGNAYGDGEDESLTITGDFSKVLVGYRPTMGVTILRDPFTAMATSGHIRVYAWLRAGVAVLAPAAFAVTDKILATAPPEH